MALRVGLTGGIGSGKSAIADCFVQLGADLIDTDRIALELTCADGAAIADIQRSFGPASLTQAGAMDRAWMRQQVFAKPELRLALEQILHPLIRAECTLRLQECRAPYVILAIPLLAEHIAEYRPILDRIAVADCDEAQQIQRIHLRPGLDEAMARAILSAQTSRQHRLALADDVIDNRGTLADLAVRAAELDTLYRKLAARQ